VVSGPIDILLADETLVSVPSDTSITITEPTDGEFVIENSGETSATIEVDGAELVLEPDQTIIIDEVAGIDVEVELHIIDQFKSGACPGGKGSCKFPVLEAEVRIFDRNDPGFQDAYGGKNPHRNIYDQVFESGTGSVGGCTISPDDAGSCTAGTTFVGENLVIIKYVADENTTVYVGRPGTQRGFGNPGKAVKRFQIIKTIKRDGTVEFSESNETKEPAGNSKLISSNPLLREETGNRYLLLLFSLIDLRLSNYQCPGTTVALFRCI